MFYIVADIYSPVYVLVGVFSLSIITDIERH